MPHSINGLSQSTQRNAEYLGLSPPTQKSYYLSGYSVSSVRNSLIGLETIKKAEENNEAFCYLFAFLKGESN
jgi:hypothetical protein